MLEKTQIFFDCNWRVYLLIEYEKTQISFEFLHVLFVQI